MSETIRILVCIKQVPDPEAPASSFRIHSETKTITAEGVPPVINPYDESALELAVRLKEANPDVRLSAVAFGAKLARAVLMKSLAVGADELYLIEDPSVEADGMITAHILATAARKIGFDLILAGRQAADTNAGGVGLALAGLLDIPAVSWARKIELEEKLLRVERVVPEGCEILAGTLPALVTVSHEAGALRMPNIINVRKAKTKPTHSWTLADLEIGKLPGRSVELTRLEAPKRERHCQVIEGESPAEAGAGLSRKLVQDGVLNLRS